MTAPARRARKSSRPGRAGLNGLPVDPRVVGGQYRCGYWGTEYTVLAIEFDGRGWLKSITVHDDDGVIRTHCTMWDAKHDRVIR